MTTNLVGQSLGRYHILEQLGEGGMATVYKARDFNLDRDVAVKVIRAEIFGSASLERIYKRFQREATALGKLTHPNIVPILDYGEYEGAPYFVMPYLPGGTLKERLKGPIPYREAVQMLIPIAQALVHAHGQGIIHRDVKPSNILITASGEPMLSDFGIAKVEKAEPTTTLTAANAGIGTPEYMAPEQGTGNSDERSDIYSLGVLLYQMVTGQIPFRADTPIAVMLKKNTESLPRPTLFVSNLPVSVERLLIKALERDPNKRYQNMASFVIALESLSSSASITGIAFDASAASKTLTADFNEESPPSAIGKAKNRWLLWTTATLLIVGCGAFLLAVAWRSLNQAEQFPPSTIASTVVSETLIPSSIPKSLIPSPISDTPLPVSAPANIPLPEDYDLAFVSDRDNEFENMRVYIVNVDRPTEFQVFENPSGYESAVWPSFCGSQLAAQLVDLDGSNPQWIYFFTLQKPPVKWLDSADALEAPRCSPDGSYIAYSVQKGEYWDLVVVKINDGDVIYHPDSRQTGKKSGYASWLENSQSFIFEVVLPNLKFFQVDNFPFSPTSSELVSTNQNLSHATFSPDGTKAAFTCFHAEICVMDLKQGNKPRSIYQTRWNVDVDWAERGAPVWSADSQWIYFPTIDGGDWDIFRIHPDGSDAENVTRDWPSNEMYPAVRW